MLDCDMYCNDSTSARQAMCFHLDHKLSPKLAFVQFPQRFYNISVNDIYDGAMRFIWTKWKGFNGIRGPILSGSGLYIKREALYGTHKFEQVYYEPSRPCFLGATPINLGEVLVQNTRWFMGLSQVALSKFSPLVYGSLRMSILQSMIYAELAYYAIYFLPVYILAIVLPLCLLRDIPLYPEVSSPFFLVFPFLFLSSQLKNMHELLILGHSIKTWSNEQRMWMIKSLTCYFFAALNTSMEKIGLIKASFVPTNKVMDDEGAKLYQMGKYNFQAPTPFMVPLCTLYILNLASFVIGLGRILQNGKTNEMLMQSFVPLFGILLNFPLLEGMVLRKDKGRVSTSVSLISAVISSIVLAYAAIC
ncbi:hypothetical protein C2S53_019700 [Perilla frutescens var. hirtella]|uniref:Cellulose synthase-like protein G2 n=1 Tax=Perilla frutescens var. hirtella TaxID=608512 RepID=A0AAD4NXQ3_PERFH|nr:hypothetical protein C2S53_019700 [Perilla frutescens var. hirtella]